jgi:hypothetical protein
MTKKKLILMGAIALVAIGLLGVILKNPISSKIMAQPDASARASNSTVSTGLDAALTDSHAQLSLKRMSKEEAVKIYLARMDADHQADWKIPIRFYGKVVDENKNPINGAVVHFDWNTIGTPGNSAQSSTMSDADGLFSLINEHGKVLEVRVEKEGYYIANGSSEICFLNTPILRAPIGTNLIRVIL